MKPTVAVLDYGSGNLRSVERALARVGADVTVTADLDFAARADGLVVPGVGAYAACMAGIDAIDGRRPILERVAAGAPVLGICVGMQVLFTAGNEHGVVTKGLGLFDGEVSRLAVPSGRPAAERPRVPHMGWNTLRVPAGSRLFAGVAADARCYFVHSYAAHPSPALAAQDTLVTTAEHGEEFVAAVERGPLWATQFHPEKSADVGATLLANWIGILR
ncbi:MAG: imidazole glycerol phosphate synthase subunit HisH [Micromonosporaceae bacterium]